MPFAHAASKTSLERELIYLENVEATYSYYVMQYRPDRNPFDAMDTPHMVMPDIDIMSYENKTGKAIDYISVWLGRKTVDKSTGELKGGMKALYAQLDTHYDKIFTSKNELMEIYKHNSRQTALGMRKQ